MSRSHGKKSCGRGCGVCGVPVKVKAAAARERATLAEVPGDVPAPGEDEVVEVNPCWPLLHVARPTSRLGPPLRATLGDLARRR
jgi:hypothetical protein